MSTRTTKPGKVAKKQGQKAKKSLRYNVSFDDKAVRTSHRYARLIAPTVKVPYRLLGHSITTGQGNLRGLPKDTGVIFAVHHMSLLDPIFVGYSMWEQGFMPHFMAKSTIFKEPLASVLRVLGQIPVIRHSASASDSLVYAKKAMAAGESVVIYPEGTLTRDPDFWPEKYKSGTARLALETGVPIVPVAHWGMHDVMPAGSKKPSVDPRRQLLVHFGKPIDVSGVELSRTNVQSLTKHIEARVAQGVAQLRGVELPQRFRAHLDWEAQ